MPGKEYYREKLMNNIKTIQKYCPDFAMSEEQINELLSDERIGLHEKYQGVELSLHAESKKRKNQIASQYSPMESLDEAFSRNMFHVVKDEKTQADKDYNKRIFRNITRDDELGETARQNYVVECMNSVFKIDLDKFGPDVSLTELAEYAMENYDIGGIAMENEHMLAQNESIGVKDKKKAHMVTQLGNTVGVYLRQLPEWMGDESFVTFPFRYLNDDQLATLNGKLGEPKKNGLIFDTGLQSLQWSLATERMRRDIPIEVKTFKERYGDRGQFTVEDLEFKVPDKNKRIGGGYLARRNAVLEGIDHLLNAKYPIDSEKIDNLKRELVNAKTLLTEEKYLNDENALEQLGPEIKKATRAIYEFKKIPEIANSKDPEVKELVNKAVTEMGLLTFFAKSGTVKDQISYYKSDLKANLAANGVLKELNDMMVPFNVTDEFGEKETLTSGDIYELRTKMAEAISAVEPLTDDVELPGNVREMMSQTKKQLEKQLKAMNKAVPGMTLEKALAGRARELDMTGHQFETMGNAQSLRMKMTVTGEDGSRQQGFFTEKKIIYREDAIANTIKLCKAEFPDCPDGLAERYADILFNAEGRRTRKDREALQEEFKEYAYLQDVIDYIDNKSGEYEENKFGLSMMMIDDKHRVRIDSRNVAMSEVATLLGQDDLIAKSTPMTLYNNGKPVEGVFMETARGAELDIFRIDKNSPFMSAGLDCLDNSPALKQIADMQVLDYICGNMDRHAGNIMYRFDENGKISGITGFDNDTSFPNLDDPITEKFGNIQGMKYVSESMANKVKNITPEMLRNALAGNEIEPQGIEYAVNRLNNMKEAINNGTVAIMPDEEFQNHKLDDFITETPSTFKLIKTEIKNVVNMSPEKRQEIMNAKDKEKHPEQVLDMFETMDKTQLTQDIEPVDAKLQQLEDAEKSVHFGSTEFDNVKQSLRSVNDANKLIAENGKLASKKNYELIQAAYEKVVRDCQSYIARKEKQGKIKDGELQVAETSKTGKRIVAVKSVLEFCKNKIQSLENSINPHGIDKVAANIKKAKDHILSQGMMEGLDPELAGNILKEMNALSANKNATTKEQMYAAQQIKTVFKYMQENGLEPKKCGLEKQDLLNAQQTVKTGRIAYAKEHPEALAKAKQELSGPQVQGGAALA